MLGFFQYIGPSIMFIMAITLFNEPFNLEKGITFAFIWGALIIFTIDMFYKRKPII
jgi:chloramphenicol-sensitive protein RarD